MSSRKQSTSFKISTLFLMGIIFFSGSLAVGAVTYSQGTVDPVNDFIIEPAKIEVFGNPGDVIEKQISVLSRIQGKTSFRLELEDFVGTDETITGTGPSASPVRLLSGDTSPYSIKTGISPEVNTFSLNMGQKITIPIRIKIPQNAAPGGFYTAVIVSNAPSKESEVSSGTGAKAISRAGALMFVRVNGDASEAGQVQDFSITPTKWIYSPGSLDFQILFVNAGNVHLAPYGTIEVKGLFGGEVKTLPIDAYYSLPQSKRYRTVPFDTSGLFGRYTATLNLNKSLHNPGANEEIETREISFWVIPYKLLAGIFVSVLILVLLITYVLKNFDIRKKK